MAAALLGARFQSHASLPRVESAGVAALVGAAADPVAIALMSERGIDLTAHRARQLTPELASSFEFILVMEEGHQRAVEQIFPAARGRIHRLGHFGGFDVPDPYRKPRSAFESSLALIERGIDDYVRAFWSDK
jgi:protein-tyrosine phosphatase